MTRKQPRPPRQHTPKPGRRAYVCEGTKDHLCGERRFMRPIDAIPECRLHGKMKREPNRAYRGQEVPE